MVLRARDDAADERDEQQDVDRREPGRRVDVEQLQVVEDRREVGVVAEVLRDAVRVGGALRHDRPGHRRDGEQQQQDEGGAHAGQLPPAPADPADEAERGLDDIAGSGAVGVVGGTQRVAHVRRARARARPAMESVAQSGSGTLVNTPCSCAIIALHTPVTMSMPRAMSRTPPMMLTARMWRRRNATESRRPAESEGQQDERDAEAQRVRESEERGPAGVAQVPGHREDRGEGRADAGRPADPQRDAEERRADEPHVALHVRVHGLLREAEDADEDEPEDDHDDAEDARDGLVVGEEELPERSAQDRDGHEHDGEARDEEEDARAAACCASGIRASTVASASVAPPLGRESAGCRPDAAEFDLPPIVRRIAARGGGAGRDGSADEPEVSRHERQDARREEREEPREDRDRDGDPQRPARHHGVDRHDSSSVSRTSVSRIEASRSCPMMRAATRPSLSITSVVGVALMGVRSANASLMAPSSAAIRLG